MNLSSLPLGSFPNHSDRLPQSRPSVFFFNLPLHSSFPVKGTASEECSGIKF